ncbi:hypothetical protein PMAYCL1PPCAC_03648, partial [Pristionchus mayeri]
GFEGNWRDISYIMWLKRMRHGLQALLAYGFYRKKWSDNYHAWAAFVIFSVVYKAGEGCLSIEKRINANGVQDLCVVLEESKIDSVALPAVSKFIKNLQSCKSNKFERCAEKLFSKYVPGPEHQKWLMELRRNLENRENVQFVLPNVVLIKGEVALKEYPESADGVIQSVLERFTTETVADLEKRNTWGV